MIIGINFRKMKAHLISTRVDSRAELARMSLS
jgi:hypothetical protein